MTPQNEPRKSKGERQSAARERARQIREQQQKRERRTRMLTIWGIVAAVVVIALVVTIVVTNNVRGQVADAGPRPANTTEGGGFVMTKTDELAVSDAAGEVSADSVVAPTASASAQGTQPASPLPRGVAAPPKGEPSQVVVYVDAACPICKQFEALYADTLSSMMDSGEITVEYRMTGLLDARASTTNFSSRAANATYCVADQDPTKAQGFLLSMFEKQPEEGGAGLSNDELTTIASDSGAGDVADCISDGTYRPFVKYVTDQASEDGIQGTPTVFVDGKRWENGTDFIAFIDETKKARNA